MAWESGGGFFQNLGNMFSGIGKGGGGFMGNFGTGTGLLSGIGQGGDRFGGQFGTGQGRIGQRFGGEQQNVTGDGNAAYNQGLVDTYNAQFQDVTGESSASGAQNQPVMDTSTPPLYQPYQSPEGVVPSTEGWGNTPALQGQDPLTAQILDTSELPAHGPQNNPNVDKFGVDQTPYQNPIIGGDMALDNVEPSINQIISRISEGGSKHSMRKDIDPLLEGEGMDSTKGWFGRNLGPGWEKAGGLKGLLTTAVAAKLGAGGGGSGGGGGSAQPQYQQQDPLQFYGGGQGYDFADVTGGGQPMQYNPLSQGLAGYYNPQLRDLR